jgi:hypothetical protein
MQGNWTISVLVGSAGASKVDSSPYIDAKYAELRLRDGRVVKWMQYHDEELD